MRTHPIRRLVAASVIALLLLAALPDAARTQSPQGLGLSTPPTRHSLAHAIVEVERLDSLRSALATTFLQSGAPADQQAFTRVCKPVGDLRGAYSVVIPRAPR